VANHAIDVGAGLAGDALAAAGIPHGGPAPAPAPPIIVPPPPPPPPGVLRRSGLNPREDDEL
jgi:hypothetical protein